MKFLKELLCLTESDKKKKKNKKDKSADVYTSYVSGNMMIKNICSGPLSGEKKVEKV